MKKLNADEMADGMSRAEVYREVAQEFHAYQKTILDVAEQAGNRRTLWRSHEVDGAGHLRENPVPQAVKPLIDLYADKDSFKGRPIETPAMQNLTKPERYNERTSGIAKTLGAAGDVTNLFPVQIDQMLRSFFG